MTRIKVSWFPDATGDRREEWAMPWATFCQNIRDMRPHPKEASPLIKLATYGDQRTRRGSLRHDGNVVEVHGLEGDYDAGEVTPEEAVRRLEAHHLRALVVTTHRHQPDAPRWRVYAPLSQPIQPQARAAYVAALNGALGGILAPESFRLSQSFYIGRPVDGEYKVLATFDDYADGQTLDELGVGERNALEVWPTTQPRSLDDDTTVAAPSSGLPDHLADMLDHIPPEQYDDWIRVGAALHYCDPTAGLDVWDQWSSAAHNYAGREDIEARWASFDQSRNGRIANAGSLVNMARQGGYAGPAWSPREIKQRIDASGVDLSEFDIHSLPQPDGDIPMFAPLALLLSRPELLAPPKEVIPRIAWQGRTTGLIGPDKSGKSTLLGHAVAALTNGEMFLDRQVERGSALIVAPDEAVGDTVRRLQEVGADPNLTRLLTLHPEKLLDYLRAEMARETPTLLVVDSLAEWARLIAGRAPDDGDAAGWGAVVRPLVQLSRDFNCATVMLHHPRRSDGQYRGSGEIAAALDCLLEIRLPSKGEEITQRSFSGRARWPIEEFAIEMVGDRYQMVGEPLPLESRILLDLSVAGPSKRNDQHQRLKVRKQTYLKTVQQMIDDGQLFEKHMFLHTPKQIVENS